jgi:predicted dehydrogenase
MTLRFGIIGCGTIAESSYLPFFKKTSLARLSSLVDTDKSRYSAMAEGFSLDYAGSGIEDIIDHVDAVIVSTPNYLHYSICKQFLSAGKHILCEKPVTTNVHDCEELINLAKKYSLKFAAAHTRRFYKASRIIKSIIDNDDLGEIRSFHFEEGTIFTWPTVSGFFFDKREAGGGVLMDIGIHLLDLLFYWLPYQIKKIDYKDDNLGGVEAFSKIKLVLSNGISGTVTISRLSVLKNRYRLEFEDGVVEWDPLHPNRVYILENSAKIKKTIKIRNEDPVLELIKDFTNAIQEDNKVFVSGDDALHVIKIVEKCYTIRKPLSLPWLTKKESSL